MWLSLPVRGFRRCLRNRFALKAVTIGMSGDRSCRPRRSGKAERLYKCGVQGVTVMPRIERIYRIRLGDRSAKVVYERPLNIKEIRRLLITPLRKELEGRAGRRPHVGLDHPICKIDGGLRFGFGIHNAHYRCTYRADKRRNCWHSCASTGQLSRVVTHSTGILYRSSPRKK